MKRSFFIPTLVVALSLVALSQTEKKPTPRGTKAEQEVMQTEQDRIKALIGGDLKALATSLADDLTYTHSNGVVETKAKFLAALESGDVKYEAMERDGVEARAYNDTVVMTGRSAMKLRARGQPLEFTIRFTNVYVKQNGRWQMVAWQSTRLPQQ